MRCHVDWACDISLLRVHKLGSEIAKLKARDNVVFRFLEPIGKISPRENFNIYGNMYHIYNYTPDIANNVRSLNVTIGD